MQLMANIVCGHCLSVHLCIAPAPRAPGHLSASVLDSTHVRVEWALLSPDEARGHVLSYTVTYSNSTKTNNITAHPMQNSVVINDLMIGSYSVLLWATNSAGAGEKSAVGFHLLGQH